MTAAESEALPAGREMDERVAETVLQYIYWVKVDGEWTRSKIAGDRLTPPFSTDIAAAWTVVEHLRSTGWQVVSLIGIGDEWSCAFDRIGADVDAPKIIGTAPTAPLAICLAALKVAALEETK